MKSSGLIQLAKEFSKQPSRKNTNIKCGRKGVSESGMELNPVIKEIRTLRNKIKGVVISEQDFTHLSFQVVERN